MEKLGCVVVDVSNKAVEETAGIVIDYMKKNFVEEIMDSVLYAQHFFCSYREDIKRHFCGLKHKFYTVLKYS